MMLNPILQGLKILNCFSVSLCIFCVLVFSPRFCSLTNRPYSRCQILKPSLVFLNRASYGRRPNNDVTSQEREATMMLRHDLRTDVQICGKSATQASLFVRHGCGVNRVYCIHSAGHETTHRNMEIGRYLHLLHICPDLHISDSHSSSNNCTFPLDLG